MKTNFNVRLAMTFVVAASYTLDDSAMGQEPSTPQLAPAIAQQIPGESEVIAVKTKVIDGQEYRFVKYLDTEGGIQARSFGADANLVTDEQVPLAKPQVLSAKLQQAITVLDEPGAVTRVNIALKVENVEETGLPGSGSAGLGDSGAAGAADAGVGAQLQLRMGGENVDVNALDAATQAQMQRAQERLVELNSQLRKKVNTLAQRNNWTDRPAIAMAVQESLPTVTMNLTHGEIAALLEENSDLIAGIELYVEPQDQIDDAMKSTRIDPDAINHNGRKGEGIGIYMTESGCCNSGHITNYKKIAGNRTDHAENVSAIMRAVSPKSFIYCRGGAVLPTAADLNGYDGNPPVHIVNRSNGGGDNDDYTTSDRDWDNFVYDRAVATFISAGNNGNRNGHHIFPSKGMNIVSVGAYDDSNNAIASFSSFKDPETGTEKPELSSAGVTVTAGGHTMSGTSMSSPHAAAFAADLMSSFSFLKSKPYLVKAHMIAGARNPIAGGKDKVGFGGTNFNSAYNNFWAQWWYGNNNSFSYHDSRDALPNNGYVDLVRTMNSSLSDVRVSLVWLNRGTYTYDHRNDAHPLGIDLDLAVLDPNGTVVASSASYDNPYEVATFDPQVTGDYRFRIKRYANRDTQSKLHMAIVIDW